MSTKIEDGGPVALLLNRHAQDNKRRMETVTKEQWTAAMDGFSPMARGRAANLAAHNWDVCLIGDRLLITSAWTGGFWVSQDGSEERIDAKLYDTLYPAAPAGVLYPLSTRGSDKKQRLVEIQFDALLASPSPARSA